MDLEEPMTDVKDEEGNPPKMVKLPLIYCTSEFDKPQRSVVDLNTKQTYIANDAAYQNAKYCFSKDGWLLMLQRNSPVTGMSRPFLLQPTTGWRIDLPTISIKSAGLFTFSTIYGIPNHVVCVDKSCCFPVIWLTTTESTSWNVLEHRIEVYVCRRITYVALIGMRVFCVDNLGRVFVFDMEGSTWISCAHNGWRKEWRRTGREFFILSNDEIVRVHCLPPCFSGFHFVKLDFGQGDWVPVDDHELDNTSWFLHSGTRSFCVADAGRKVYTLLPDDDPIVPVADGGKEAYNLRPNFRNAANLMVKRPTAKERRPVEANVNVHNLVDGTKESAFSDPVIAKHHSWVDPSCFTVA